MMLNQVRYRLYYSLATSLMVASTLPGAAKTVAKAKPTPSAALPKKTAPRGMLELPTGGKGRVLTSRMGGSRSARKMLMALKMGIVGYFDTAPKITAAFADRADQNLQGTFTAQLKGVPVRGVVAISLHGDSGQATLIFDRAAAFRQSFARLVQQVNRPAPRRGGKVAPVRLTMTALPDGSGKIGLPPGWRITNAYKGTVDAVGPGGASMGLGGYVSVVSKQTRGAYQGSPMVDFTNPVQAALDYAAFQNYQAQQAGQPGGRVTRVIDTAPANLGGNGHAAFMRFSAVLGGQPIEALGLYSITPIDETQGLLYFSVVMAPAAQFKQALPAMWAAWQSWGINDSVLRERMNSAVQSMRDTGDIISSANANRQETYARVNQAWDHYINDESVWSNSNTGKRYIIPNSALPPDGDTGSLVPVPTNEL